MVTAMGQPLQRVKESHLMGHTDSRGSYSASRWHRRAAAGGVASGPPRTPGRTGHAQASRAPYQSDDRSGQTVPTETGGDEADDAPSRGPPASVDTSPVPILGTQNGARHEPASVFARCGSSCREGELQAGALRPPEGHRTCRDTSIRPRAQPGGARRAVSSSAADRPPCTSLCAWR